MSSRATLVGWRARINTHELAWGIRADPGAFHVPDTGRYLHLAGALVETHQFTFNGEAELYRPPGFPLLLAPGVAAGWPTAAAGVAAAALSAYVRLIGYLLPFALVLFTLMFASTRQTRRPGRAIRAHAAFAIVLAAVVLGSWHVRNYLAAGYAGFSMQVERAAYLVGGGTVAARQAGRSYNESVSALGGGPAATGTATAGGLSPCPSDSGAAPDRFWRASRWRTSHSRPS